MNQDGGWKQKYLNSLDDLDRSEARVQAFEALLARALGRLVVLAQGHDAGLDQDLSRLKMMLRPPLPLETVRSLFDTISTQLVGHSAASPLLGALRALWQRLGLSSEDVERASGLIGKMGSTGTQEGPVRELAALIRRTLLTAHSPEEQEAPPVARLLGILLDQLELPDSPETRALEESVRAALAQGSHDESAVMLTHAVAHLVNQSINALQSDKQDLENFLRQLTSRLDDFDSFFASEQRDRSDAQADRTQLEQAVNAEVSAMNAGLAVATDLNELKQHVQARLDGITRHVRDYKASEEARARLAESRMEVLQGQLHDLQKETDNLHRLLAENRDQLMRDPLTGVQNRLSYEQRVQEEFHRWQRFEEPLTLLVWDVDLFKNINDRYGHAVGDQVLQAVAQALTAKLRSTDLLARYGGEEFVMLLPGADLHAAFLLAERIRASIAANSFLADGREIRLSVSCGLSSFVAGDTPTTVFDRADQALYEAKRLGRNRCQMAGN